MKLYYMPGACSLADHIALEWANADYEAQAVSREALKQPEFLALNPMGSVPCLTDGDFVLTQNVAILHYLDEKFPQAALLGGTDLQTRANAMRWLAFCNADLHEAFVPIFAPMRFIDDEAVHPALQAKAREKVIRLLGVANNALNGKQYLAGVKTVADAYLFVILRWAMGVGIDLTSFANLNEFINTMSQDSGVQNAMKAEGL
ncbi:MAG: glutathione S-transferase N-terminal domain-containing protein [Neisseriaceae bacterium]|nr:glutathione S-transferase N-terminal domain-containing protein [Neisseriaceae bacterium]